jgi:lipopolysaccharide biosynthesis glycosyltransferase
MSDRAVCYISDLPFLAPSLASALRLREFVSADVADVWIFTINVEADLISTVNRSLASSGVTLVALNMDELGGFDAGRLAKTQTPLGTFGRFFMEEALPDHYRHIVYLDGDVWPVRDPTELITADVPDGCIAAAHDPVTYRRRVGQGATARSIDAYFQQLGVAPERGYFNAGVLAASRPAWREIMKDAYAFYKNNTDLCKHFDQSALNAVAGKRRVALSCRWNFQTQYKIWNADSVVSPRIYHFTRNPKPWSCKLEPWPEMFDEYQRIFTKLSEFGLPIKFLNVDEAAAANAERKNYAYLRLPPVSWLARSLMDFSKTEGASWI